jgi:hypothetical protein
MFLLPIESNQKLFMETICSFKTKPSEPKKGNKNNSVSNSQPSIIIDPIRKELVLGHRKQFDIIKNAYNSIKKENGKKIVNLSIDSKSKTKLGSLANLKKINFNDINFSKDHTLNGYVITVTNSDVIFQMSSFLLLVQDENKVFQRLAIYNLNLTLEEVNSKFPFGCTFQIVNPYCRIAAGDGKPVIRVDDPNTIFVIDDEVKKMCRFCFKDGCKSKCSKCNMAYYCSKDCQDNDYKNLNHKLICSN